VHIGLTLFMCTKCLFCYSYVRVIKPFSKMAAFKKSRMLAELVIVVLRRRQKSKRERREFQNSYKPW